MTQLAVIFCFLQSNLRDSETAVTSALAWGDLILVFF